MAAMDIVVATKEVRDDRRPHRVPAMNEISCEYDPAVGAVEVVSLSGTLITSVKLTNMFTGQTVVDVSETSLVTLSVPSDGLSPTAVSTTAPSMPSASKLLYENKHLKLTLK